MPTSKRNKGKSRKDDKTKVHRAAKSDTKMATDAVASQAPLDPTPNECQAWRLGSFRRRVLEAVADWAREPTSDILPSNTLGELAKDVPWGEGQQGDLVQSVNAHDVYHPFPNTRMMAPSQVASASTTVGQWERIVWEQQSPRTACFFKVS